MPNQPDNSSLLPPPEKSAWEIQMICAKYSPKHVNKIERFQRPLFLRSSTLDYKSEHEETKQKTASVKMDVVKTKTQNPLEYSPHTGLKLDCPPQYRAITLNPYSYGPIPPWEPQPQFWYNSSAAHKGPTWPVGNPNDYKFKALEQPPKEGSPILESLEIERSERYIPGEIYKNKVPKEPIKDLTATGGCTPTWVPKNKETFNAKFDNSSVPHETVFTDFVQENETKHRNLIQPYDESFYKKPEPLSMLMNKFKFIPLSERNEKRSSQKTFEANYKRHSRIGKTCCEESVKRCQPDKHIFRNDRDCSCCNSKYV